MPDINRRDSFRNKSELDQDKTGTGDIQNNQVADLGLIE